MESTGRFAETQSSRRSRIACDHSNGHRRSRSLLRVDDRQRSLVSKRVQRGRVALPHRSQIRRGSSDATISFLRKVGSEDSLVVHDGQSWSCVLSLTSFFAAGSLVGRRWLATSGSRGLGSDFSRLRLRAFARGGPVRTFGLVPRPPPIDTRLVQLLRRSPPSGSNGRCSERFRPSGWHRFFVGSPASDHLVAGRRSRPLDGADPKGSADGRAGTGVERLTAVVKLWSGA